MSQLAFVRQSLALSSAINIKNLVVNDAANAADWGAGKIPN